jgi:peptidoglycan/LPS O-acetylase OafA/YrhL
MNRIKELDYLRGLAAFSIMIYHYMKWLHIYEGAQSFVGRLSVYGVEIFYLLSGITLFHVYHTSIEFEWNKIYPFFIKRFFRIFPLFWLCIFITLVIRLKLVSFEILFINISGLFSLIAWDNYIAPGAWSIGNELVFYLIFPFLIIIQKQNKVAFALLGLIFLILFNYFAFYIFDPTNTLHNQWTNYVNPLNHLLIFYLGILIPVFLKRGKENALKALFAFTIGAVLLFKLPTGKDGIHLLYGINRWLFTLGAILISSSFYWQEMNLPKSIDQFLKYMGTISYGIYLLHPLIYEIICIIVRKLILIGFNFPQSNWLLIIISVLATITISHFVYQYFERYFIRKGEKKIANFYKS